MENKEQNLNFQKSWAKIIAKAWSDPAFKDKLLKGPKEVFKTFDIDFPEGVDVVVLENTEKKVHLVLQKQWQGELSEEELNQISAGTNCQNQCSVLYTRLTFG